MNENTPKAPQEYSANPASGAAGWLRNEHDAALRRWVHWGFGTAIAAIPGYTVMKIGVAVGSVTTAGVGALLLVPALAVGAVVGIGLFVNVARGAFNRSVLNPNPSRRFFRRNAR